MNHTISQELIHELQKLEQKQQEQVLSYTREVLTAGEMSRRAELSEKAISAGNVKSFDFFDQEFEQWIALKKDITK